MELTVMQVAESKYRFASFSLFSRRSRIVQCARVLC